MKTLSLGQASSKCAFPFFSYLIPNAFSLVDMNNNLPLRWGFMNQDEKKESPEFSFFFLPYSISFTCISHKPTIERPII